LENRNFSAFCSGSRNQTFAIYSQKNQFIPTLLHLAINEDDYELVKLNMTREINLHKSLYEKVSGGKKCLKYVLAALVSAPKRAHSVAPEKKWFTFPDMGHVIATYYGKVVVELTKPSIGFSETFFPLRGGPPRDPSSKILCMGL
jgi:hypothetical protein